MTCKDLLDGPLGQRLKLAFGQCILNEVRVDLVVPVSALLSDEYFGSDIIDSDGVDDERKQQGLVLPEMGVERCLASRLEPRYVHAAAAFVHGDVVHR